MEFVALRVYYNHSTISLLNNYNPFRHRVGWIPLNPTLS